MELPKDTIQRIESAVVEEARLHTDLVRQFLSDLQIQYPAFVGLIAALSGTLLGFVVTDTRLSLTLPLLVVSVALLVLVVAQQNGKNKVLQRAYVSTTEAYLAYAGEHDSHVRSREAQERQLQWLLALTVMLEKAMNYVACARTDPGSATPEAAARACHDLLGTLEEVRHVCLRYPPDDRTYNLHVFRFDTGSQRLAGFARRHGSDVVPKNRTWRSGLGHAGRCFDSGEMMCLPDLEGPEGQGYRYAVQDLDKKLYRAIIDAPIHCGATIWGVLAITSGTPGQFTKADFAPLALVSGIFGMVVAATSWVGTDTPPTARGT